MKDIEFTREEVAAAVEQDGWVKDIAARFGKEPGLAMDEVFHFNLDFICRHWPLQPHEVTYWHVKRVCGIICQL